MRDPAAEEGIDPAGDDDKRLRAITTIALAMILALVSLAAALSGPGGRMPQPPAIAVIAGVTLKLPPGLLVMPVMIGLTLREKGSPLSADR